MSAPGWFARAVADEPEVCRVSADGVGINYLAWGRVGAPGLVFVHGGAAHAHWW